MENDGLLDFDGSDHDDRNQTVSNDANKDEAASLAYQPSLKKKAKCSSQILC
jgi:hypothetical protein